MALFNAYPRQMEAIRVYQVYCIKCKKKIYSDNGESRYDFIQRLRRLGWDINQESPSKYQVFCPDCRSKEQF